MEVPSKVALIIDFNKGMNVPASGKWPRLKQGLATPEPLNWDLLMALAIIDGLAGDGDNFWQVCVCGWRRAFQAGPRARAALGLGALACRRAHDMPACSAALRSATGLLRGHPARTGDADAADVLVAGAAGPAAARRHRRRGAQAAGMKA
jgi:hypothetical protein